MKKLRLKVLKFLENYQLKNKKLMVALSGGVDSMVLSDILISLDVDVSFLHINHNMREEMAHSKDFSCIKEYLENKGLQDSLNYHVIEDRILSNKESLLRVKRKEIFKEYQDKGFLILTGHHLNDSFEWNLMQSFKSPNKIGLQYISPINEEKTIARPLSFINKKDIEFYAEENSIPFSFDETNKDNDIERNYVRNVLVGNILKKYPNALDTYLKQWETVLLSNKEKGFVCFSKVNKGLYEIKTENISYNSIKDVLYKLSPNKGKYHNQIVKTIETINKGNRKFKMSFSNGITLLVEKDTTRISS